MKIQQILNLISQHVVNNTFPTDDQMINILTILATLDNEDRQNLESAVRVMKNNNNVDQLQNNVNHEEMVSFFQSNGQSDRSDETQLVNHTLICKVKKTIKHLFSMPKSTKQAHAKYEIRIKNQIQKQFK